MFSQPSDDTVDYDPDDGVLVLTGSASELHVRIEPQELERLSALPTAVWEDGRSIAAGTALGNPVFWCLGSEQGTVHVLVGHDDQTWGLAVTIAIDALDPIVLR
jgi:hypothetical protein